MTAAPAALSSIRRVDEAEFYPRDLLAGCADALILFAAGFLGRQDAVWVADAGLEATCVDIDTVRLEQMAELYPAGWEFVCQGVFDYAPAMDGRRVWDVVSLDPPTQLFGHVARLAPLWARLARRAVIIGCGPSTLPEPPSGWRAGPQIHRSDYRGGVLWATLERTA